MSLELELEQRWWRSDKEFILAGVCGGLAEKFDIAPWTVRLLWLISFLFLGTGLVFYLFAAFAFPKYSKLSSSERKEFLGVCYNLSIKLKTAPEILRFICLVLGVTSFGATFLLYLILAFTLPAPDFKSL